MTHTQKSFIKSFIRIAGYASLLIDIKAAAIILVISELVGIWEEI